jgi:hypothetical protein
MFFHTHFSPFNHFEQQSSYTRFCIDGSYSSLVLSSRVLAVLPLLFAVAFTSKQKELKLSQL